MKRLSRRVLLLGLIVVLAAADGVIWSLVLAATPRGVLTFAVLNVGQGDALYIESPTGAHVLLDAGPDSSVLRELSKVMPPFAHTLDLIIESHPDSDHMAGFVDVLARYRVGAYLTPGIFKDSTVAYTLERDVHDDHIPRYIARRGEVIDLGGGAQLKILFPDHDVTGLGRGDDNAGAVVAQLVYGGTSVMLTSDMPQDIEQHLVALEQSDLPAQAGGADELGSTILKVGHHGSRNSTSAAFVAAVHPLLAVISVGANNRYGHPSSEALRVLAAAGVPVERTDEDGTLIYESDGAHFWQIK